MEPLTNTDRMVVYGLVLAVTVLALCMGLR